jgi:ubiquinone/menaquinone biosynthesis C-methylase UbiE
MNDSHYSSPEGHPDVDWLEHLVCPLTKQRLHLQGDKLITTDNRRRYNFKNGIACFLTPEERKSWDDYHIKITNKPIVAHPHYVRFTDGWKIMLDMGCGDGTMSASSAHKVRHIYCLNPGYIALQVLQKRGLRNMYPVNAFGEKTPFKDNFFDGVFNIFVIEHVGDPLPMLAEIHRILKPSGRLVIATDTANYYRFLRPIFQWKQMGWRRGWRKWKPNDPTHINMMKPANLRRHLSKAHFTIIEENIHYFTGAFRAKLGWLPHSIWESWLSYMFIFVCRKF